MRIPSITLIPIERSLFFPTQHEEIAGAAKDLANALRLHGSSADELRVAEVSLSENIAAWPELVEHYKPGGFDRDLLIRVQGETDYDLSVVDGLEGMEDERRRVSYAEIHVASVARKLVGDLAIVGNLARPGAISLRRGVVVVGTTATA